MEHNGVVHQHVAFRPELCALVFWPCVTPGLPGMQLSELHVKRQALAQFSFSPRSPLQFSMIGPQAHMTKVKQPCTWALGMPAIYASNRMRQRRHAACHA